MTVYNAGSLNIDDVFRVPHIVKPGETIPSRSFERFAGGKGLNQSIALARAGIKVKHFGRISEDGLFLKNILEKENADASGIVSGTIPTGHAIIQVSEGGENSIVLFGGANRSWSNKDVEKIISEIPEGGVLLLQNEINITGQLIDAAGDAGINVVLNPAPMDNNVFQYSLKKLRWLIVNEIEGRELAGTDGAEDITVVEKLTEMFPETTVVMTLGKRGALRGDNSGKIISASFSAPYAVVDTTAAGDTFTGYFIAGELSGLEPVASLRRACAAGALAVTKAGAVSSIPYMEDVEELLRK